MQQHVLTLERESSVANRFSSGVRVWLSNYVQLLHYVGDNPYNHEHDRTYGRSSSKHAKNKHVSQDQAITTQETKRILAIFPCSGKNPRKEKVSKRQNGPRGDGDGMEERKGRTGGKTTGVKGDTIFHSKSES